MRYATIPIEAIRYDEQHPYRNTPLCYITVWAYRERLRNGAAFPPIVVTPDPDSPEKYLIVDGYHRLAAYHAEKHTHIMCEVAIYPSPKERYLDSVRRNATHGKPLAPIDIAVIDAVAVELEIPTHYVLEVLQVSQEYLERIRARKRTNITVNGFNIPIAKSWEPYKEIVEDNPEIAPFARRALGTSLTRIVRQLLAILELLTTDAVNKHWDLLVELYQLLHHKLLTAKQQSHARPTRTRRHQQTP